jgi:hypothetical protein
MVPAAAQPLLTGQPAVLPDRLSLRGWKGDHGAAPEFHEAQELINETGVSKNYFSLAKLLVQMSGQHQLVILPESSTGTSAYQVQPMAKKFFTYPEVFGATFVSFCLGLFERQDFRQPARISCLRIRAYLFAVTWRSDSKKRRRNLTYALFEHFPNVEGSYSK